MSLSLQLWSPSKLRRATCLACSPFIFAFIAFNILDLDGSNLASLTKCSNRLVIDADVGPSARVEPLPQRLEYFDNHRTLKPNDSSDQARWEIAELRALSRLEKARTHLYHVSLPRDAVPG
jgi:hypothetical protein